MQVQALRDLVPEAKFARELGVAASQLSRIRREHLADGCWVYSFGAYMWIMSMKDRVTQVLAKKTRAQRESQRESHHATLWQLRSRERRLYAARMDDGAAILVVTRRLHPLGTKISVEHSHANCWFEAETCATASHDQERQKPAENPA